MIEKRFTHKTFLTLGMMMSTAAVDEPTGKNWFVEFLNNLVSHLCKQKNCIEETDIL